ncbi:hypothetical protein [Myroides odoratus]|uniref:hypothetical protein n=1 Tax=Myroides odoratus TaxID=256 RepID=UPI0039AEC52C
MKRILFYACFLTIAYTANAQVGIGTPNPKGSAMLDVEATDKGILIPRVTLTSRTVFAPITGEQVDGLLVYNLGGPANAPEKAMPSGFYFWKNQEWNQVVDQVNLEETITNLVSGDIGEAKKIVDYLVPTNPSSSDKTIPQGVLVYDTENNKIYHVVYDAVNQKYTKVDVDLTDFIQGFESATLIKRAKVATAGAPLEFHDTEAVVPADTKLGEIYYQYTGENGRVDYLNLTEDIQQIFNESDIIKNEITNIINNDGGNVYFTNVEITEGNIPANSLYQVDPVTKEKKIIDVEANIKNFFEEKLEFIKQEIGDKVTNNISVNTGNKIDGDDVFLFKNSASFTNAGAKIDEVTITLPTNTTTIDRIVSIKLFRDKKIISSSVTGVSITGSKINFYMGEGSMYYPQTAGTNYEVMIEFTAR